MIAYLFGVSVPLVFLGSFIGFKKNAIETPFGYNIVPKIVKKKPWYLKSTALCFIGGLLPFGSFFVELNFIMISIWQHEFYYLFTILFISLLILLIMCAEISIVYVYILLCQ